MSTVVSLSFFSPQTRYPSWYSVPAIRFDQISLSESSRTIPSLVLLKNHRLDSSGSYRNWQLFRHLLDPAVFLPTSLISRISREQAPIYNIGVQSGDAGEEWGDGWRGHRTKEVGRANAGGRKQGEDKIAISLRPLLSPALAIH